jgi:ADP-ribose diphosphatase
MSKRSSLDSAHIKVIGQGRHLHLLSINDWEYVQRAGSSGIVVIVPVTEEGELVFVEQFRPPVGARVIEFPAGLVGDIPGAEDEGLLEAARRELLEETGYDGQHFELLNQGPVSAGLSNEVITMFLATDVRKTGPGGGDDSEDIQVHVVAAGQVPAWLQERQEAGILIDVKIPGGLYYAHLGGDLS